MMMSPLYLMQNGIFTQQTRNSLLIFVTDLKGCNWEKTIEFIHQEVNIISFIINRRKGLDSIVLAFLIFIKYDYQITNPINW